ncbi:MAG: hypothetical protein AAF764_04020 [Pseudomonadota bacterium]
MRPRLVTAPASPVVDLTTLKAWLRVEHSDEDDLITELEQAAVAVLDGWSGLLGRCLVTQTWALDLVDFVGRMMPKGGGACGIELPFPDTSEVVVTYLDADGVEQTLDAANVSVVRSGGADWAVLTSQLPDLDPDTNTPVTVTQTCGYGEAGDVPSSLQLAIKATVAQWYDDRASTGSMPDGAASMVERYRWRCL